MTTTLRAVLKRAEVDRAVALATLGNMFTILAGPVASLLIAVRFTPELQGYYYTFGSFTLLPLLLDMGLGQAIIQFASHEWSQLGFDEHGGITGDADAHARLVSLGRTSLIWYGVASLVILLFLTPAGFLFFARNGSDAVHWEGPWVAMCIGLAATFALSPIFYLIQGCNQVNDYWYYRLWQKMLYTIPLCIAIVLGAQLWSLPIALATSLIYSVYFLWRRFAHFSLSFTRLLPGPRISWRHEVWPIQWRIAISWLSMLYTTALFAPILFKASGPVEAGQIGMTVTLCNVLIALATNWVTTRAPTFGILIAERKYAQLDNLFWRLLRVTIGVLALGAVAIVVGVLALNVMGVPLAQRILPLGQTTILVIATVASAIAASLAIYLRAHKREPLAPVFLASALLTIGLAYVTALQVGSWGVAVSYFVVAVGIQLPLSIVVFFSRRRAYHGQTSG